MTSFFVPFNVIGTDKHCKQEVTANNVCDQIKL